MCRRRGSMWWGRRSTDRRMSSRTLLCVPRPPVPATPSPRLCTLAGARQWTIAEQGLRHAHRARPCVTRDMLTGILSMDALRALLQRYWRLSPRDITVRRSCSLQRRACRNHTTCCRQPAITSRPCTQCPRRPSSIAGACNGFRLPPQPTWCSIQPGQRHRPPR